MNIPFRANWTAKSQYDIDFLRGRVTHSKTASNRQFNNIFADKWTNSQIVPHLEYPYNANWFMCWLVGERYLQMLRRLVGSEHLKMVQQCSKAYIENHHSVIQKAFNTLRYPVGQLSTYCYHRSPLDKQKLVNLIEDQVKQSRKYGQIQTYPLTKAKKDIITDELRKMAFK